MSKVFRDMNGKRFEIERETKTLKLESVIHSDYYKGKNHDDFRFTDGDGNEYVYDASLNAEMTEYDSKFAKELAFEEGKVVKVSAYFLPSQLYRNTSYIYNPRIVEE